MFNIPLQKNIYYRSQYLKHHRKNMKYCRNDNPCTTKLENNFEYWTFGTSVSLNIIFELSHETFCIDLSPIRVWCPWNGTFLSFDLILIF